LKLAEKKGIDDIQVLPKGKNFEYYFKIFTFFNRDGYRTERKHMDKMAYTQYCMGKIQFKDDS